MVFTLVFGAPVRSGDHKFGTLTRIIVNNGVANQFAVNPSGLFSGPERIVPISDVIDATPDEVALDISDVDWRAYNAFDIDHILASDRAAAPDLLEAGPRGDLTSEVFDRPTAEAPSEDRALSASSVVLTHQTQVGDRGRLAGLVIDTGIPKQILVDGGATIPIEQIAMLDEKHITLGEPPPRLDSVTPPSSVGQK